MAHDELMNHWFPVGLISEGGLRGPEGVETERSLLHVAPVHQKDTADWHSAIQL